MPTTIALLSDVHANAPALRAVLRDAKKFNPAEVWYLGDFLGYSPYPNEVVDIIRKLPAKSIVGNYDLKVLDFPHFRNKWKGKKDPAKYFSFAWTYNQLGKSQKKYLRQLPEQRWCVVEGQKFLLVHGSPYGIDDGLDPVSGKKKLKKIAKGFKGQAVLCGHTHQSFAKKISGVWFINPGSIGRPFDGDARAAYAVLKITERKIKVTHQRVKYPLRALKVQMQKEKFPKIIIESVTKARSVDALRGEI